METDATISRQSRASAPVAMKEAITSVMAQTSILGAQPTPAPVLGIIAVWLSLSTYSRTRHAKLPKPLALKDFHVLHVLGASLLCGCIYIIHIFSSVRPPRAEELLTTLNIPSRCNVKINKDD